jgi:Predicted transcriptional regulator containing an HTH domain and an uncharacterized domain shared with the mammalian protein Schlafen
MASLTDTIDALLWEDESTTLDFKEQQYPLTSDDEKAELIKDILAFTNAFRRETAYILLGIRESKGGRGIVTGITHHVNDHDLQQLVNTKTNRIIEFSYHALTLDNQHVGIIQIPRQQRPVYLTKNFGKLTANTVYLRHGSSTSIATPDEIARMGNDQQHAPRTSPEISALQNIHEHARFYQRIIRLWENITRIPDHYITTIARSAAYEHERRALHVRFNEEYDRFGQAQRRARHPHPTTRPRHASRASNDHSNPRRTARGRADRQQPRLLVEQPSRQRPPVRQATRGRTSRRQPERTRRTTTRHARRNTMTKHDHHTTPRYYLKAFSTPSQRSSGSTGKPSIPAQAEYPSRYHARKYVGVSEAPFVRSPISCSCGGWCVCSSPSDVLGAEMTKRLFLVRVYPMCTCPCNIVTSRSRDRRRKSASALSMTKKRSCASVARLKSSCGSVT